MNSSTSPTKPELIQALNDLALRGLAGQIDDFLLWARDSNADPAKLLERIVAIETQDRVNRSLQRRLKFGRLGSFKPISDFDWNWPSAIDRERVERALKQRYMEDGSNVILLGAHGLGKTMILKNIAYQAVLAGHSVLFVSASKLLTDLSAQESARALEQRLRYYVRFKALAVDELGYLSYDSRAADLLFEVVSRRHEAKKPLLLTTNLAFADWAQVFPNASSTVALVDRLTHLADIIKVEGKSYRRKESLERQARQRIEVSTLEDTEATKP